jgi:hypothetical protein
MRRIGGVSIVSTVALTAVLVCATPGSSAMSQAGGGWLEPTQDLTQNAEDVQVAVTPDGQTALTVWAWAVTLSGSTRRPGGTWEPPAQILGGPDFYFRPHVALDRAGNALLTVTRYDSRSSLSEVVAYTKAATANTWSGPERLVTDRDTGTNDFAANDAGQAVVAWKGPDSNHPGLSIIHATPRASDGHWGPHDNLGYGDTDPDAAIDASGNILVLWRRGRWDGNDNEIWAAFRPAAGEWQPSVKLASSAMGGTQVEVVMNRRGDAIAVWAQDNRLVSSRRPAGTSSWSAPAVVPLTNPGKAYYAYSDGPALALDEHGNATVVESRDDGGVEATTLSGNAERWEGPVVLGNGGDDGGWYTKEASCLRPRLKLDAAGGAIAVWGGSSLFAARRPAGSAAWDKVVVVSKGPPSAVCYQRAFAVDSAGDAIVLFRATELGRTDVAVLDTTAPTILRATAPRSTVIGRRVRFSVATHDHWSRVTGFQWAFGDGTRMQVRGTDYADGNFNSTVRHAYRRPGSYRVTVTASDAAGNVVRRSLTVVARRKR